MRDDVMNRRKAASGVAAAITAPLVPTDILSAAMMSANVSGSYILTRGIEREIRNGATVDVSRSWSIIIKATREGLIVEGRQTNVTVSAPPILSALAEIERQRDASHFFPITLDSSGLIFRSGVSDGSALARGVETARTLFRSLPGVATGGGSPADTLSRITTMSAGAVSQIPRDLFFPVPGSSTETRRIPLSGGGEGQIRVTAFAEVATATGLLSKSRRDIVTIVGEDTRRASEVWTLQSS